MAFSGASDEHAFSCFTSQNATNSQEQFRKQRMFKECFFVPIVILIRAAKGGCTKSGLPAI